MRSLLSVASILAAVLLVIVGMLIASGLPVALGNLTGEPEDVVILLLLLFGAILAAAATGLNGLFLSHFRIRERIPLLALHFFNLASLGFFMCLGVTAVASHTASLVEIISATVPMFVVMLGYWQIRRGL